MAPTGRRLFSLSGVSWHRAVESLTAERTSESLAGLELRSDKPELHTFLSSQANIQRNDANTDS